MSKPDTLAKAKADSAASRARFAETLGEVQERIKPSTLLHDAWSGIRERGDQAAGDAIDLARRRPGTAAGIAASIAVILLRHPLSRAVTSLFSSGGETEAAADKLKTDEHTAKPPARRRRAATIAKGD